MTQQYCNREVIIYDDIEQLVSDLAVTPRALRKKSSENSFPFLPIPVINSFGFHALTFSEIILKNTLEQYQANILKRQSEVRQKRPKSREIIN